MVGYVEECWFWSILEVLFIFFLLWCNFGGLWNFDNVGTL